jgi:hypothetical protein
MSEELNKKINSYIRNRTKIQLINECKEKNLSISGTKNDMALRIFQMIDPPKKKNILPTPNTLKITKNKFNNYCHEETQLVFDPISKRVIGIQLENGNIRCLKRNDIDICKQYKFKYNIPNELEEVYEILENSDNENNDINDESDNEYLDDDDDDELFNETDDN